MSTIPTTTRVLYQLGPTRAQLSVGARVAAFLRVGGEHHRLQGGHRPPRQVQVRVNS